MRVAAGLPRIRRFFSERPRPIAAILTGFSHNTGNLAQSRENPFPSPRSVPAPGGISPAPLRRRAAGGAGAWRKRGSDPGSPCGSRRAHPSARLGARGRGCTPRPPRASLREAAFPTRGIPLMEFAAWRMLPLQCRGNRNQSRSEPGGGRDAAARHLRKPSCPISSLLSSLPFLIDQFKRCLLKNKAAHGFNNSNPFLESLCSNQVNM